MLTRRGYTASGWNTAEDGTGDPYADGATYTGNAALTLYPAWTAWTYPWITTMSAGSASIDVGKSTTITSTVANASSLTGVTYTVYSGATGDTLADAEGYTLSNQVNGATSTVTFTGNKPGTYYVKAEVTDGTTTDTFTTRVRVGVTTPSATFDNLTCAVNSDTVLEKASITNEPEYYKFEYSVDDGSTWNTSSAVSSDYIKIDENGKLTALKKTDEAITVKYRLLAGTDASHITYTQETPGSFTVTVAAPTVTYDYPPASGGSSSVTPDDADTTYYFLGSATDSYAGLTSLGNMKKNTSGEYYFNVTTTGAYYATISTTDSVNNGIFYGGTNGSTDGSTTAIKLNEDTSIRMTNDGVTTFACRVDGSGNAYLSLSNAASYYIIYNPTAGTIKATTTSPASPAVTVVGTSSMLLEDTSKTASLNTVQLANYDVNKNDVTWSITTGSSLMVNPTSGKLTPLTAGDSVLCASVKYNDSYTEKYYLKVTVVAATLTVNGEAQDHHIDLDYESSESGYRATDYVSLSEKTFTVATNAKNGTFDSLTTVTIEKEEGAHFEFYVDDVEATSGSATLSAASSTIKVVSTGLNTEPESLVIRYWIGSTEVASIARTVTVSVNQYETWLTIYFSVPTGRGTLSDAPYAYVWEPGDEDVKGYLAKPYLYSDVADRKMIKIGTMTVDDATHNVFAQNYKKIDIMGTAGHAHSLLFKGNNDTTTWNKQTENAQFPEVGGVSKGAFDNYQYFRGGSERDNKFTAITTENYGCLKPTSATVTVTKQAMAATQFSEINFAIADTDYTKGSKGDLVGYYSLTNDITATDATDLFDFKKHDDTTPAPNAAALESGTDYEIKATGKSGVNGTYTIAGNLYFTADDVLEVPVTDSTADDFIALPFKYGNANSVDIAVANVTVNVHNTPVQLSGGSYIELTGTGMSNTTPNNIGDTISITAKKVDGYTFIGYRVVTNDDTPITAGFTDVPNVVHTGDGTDESPYTISVDLDQMVDNNPVSLFKSDYYVYAIYRPNITISASKSYSYAADHDYATTYLTAPPKTIQIERDGEVVAAYTYDNTASATSRSDASPATYGDGTAIPLAADSFTVVAGDKVTMTYAMLAASDKIAGVFYHNTYAPFADAENYQKNKAVLTPDAIDQKAHTVTFTVADQTKHITVELGTKHRLTFADSEGFTTSGMNIGGYYADTEPIEFTVKKASSVERVYTLGAPVFYDTDGKILVSALPGEIPTGLSASDYHVDEGFDLSYLSGRFTGDMPAYDVVIDMNVTVGFSMKFKTKILSDRVNGNAEFTIGDAVTEVMADASKLTITRVGGGAFTLTTPTATAGPADAGTEIEMGTSLIYSVELQAGYTFLGWYKGDDKGPDFDHETSVIDTATTFSYTPTESTYVWAVATRDFFIAGNFTYNEETGALTHKTGTRDTDNNSTNWTNKDEYYLMEYDAAEDAYAITFKSFSAGSINTKTDSSGYNPCDGGTSDPDLDKVYLFKCYRTQGDGTNVGNSTDWGFVTNYTNGSWIQYGTDKNTNDHMFYGKWNGSGGSGMFMLAQKTINDGYNVPVTLYFKPGTGSGGSKWYVKASHIWPNIYISDGYQTIDTFTNTDNYTGVTRVKGIADGSTLTERAIVEDDYVKTTGSTNGTGDAVLGHENAVNKYNFKFNEDVEITLSKTVDANHSVPGFLVYDLKDDRVYPAAATPPADVATDYTYTAKIKVTSHDLYVCPIIYYSGSDAITINVDATRLDKNEWGDLISCYAWYSDASGNNSKSAYPNGQYPGQLMYPSDDAGTWTAQFKPTADGSLSMSGITFSNYTSNSGANISDNTWLGRGVLVDGTVRNGDLINRYNDVKRSKEDKYNKHNVSVQSYDYREPYSFYESKVRTASSDEDKAVLSFAFKYGDNDVMKFYHNYLTNNYADEVDPDSVNIFTGIHHIDSDGNHHTVASGDYKLSPSSFEMMTDATGNFYVDLNGTLLDDQPSPSFYIIAKGQAKYTNDSLTSVNRSGDNEVTPATTVTYPGSHGVSQQYAVQWYVYDANGDYITNILSAGFADEDSGQTLIAKELTELGYAVDGKGVGISYDFPRYYTSTNIYRFEGQWYATEKTTPVYVNAKVGIYSNGSYILSKKNIEGYGSAKVYYNYDVGADKYESYVATDAPDRSYVKLAIGDAPNSPVYLSCLDTNFKGWYYKDQQGEMIPASTDSVHFTPVFAANTTYYAIYEVKANYTFKYLDRDGASTSYVRNVYLNSLEIKGYAGNGGNPGVPTYIWSDEIAEQYNEAMGIEDSDDVGELRRDETGATTANPYVTVLRSFEEQICSYQYATFTWPSSNDGSTPEGTSIVPVSDRKSLEITALCPKASYVITYKTKTGEGGVWDEGGSVKVESGKVLSFDPNYHLTEGAVKVVDYVDQARQVKYWSTDPEGNKPLTAMWSYGLVITHGGTIYGQTKELTGAGNPWKPLIESLSKTEKKTLEKNVDKHTTYLDFNSYFVNINGLMYHDIASNQKSNYHYGIIVAYHTDTNTAVDFTSDTPELSVTTLKQYINYFRLNPTQKAGRIDGTDIILTCYDYYDDAHISNRNRTNFVISGEGAFLHDKNLSVFTYVYDQNASPKIALSSTKFYSDDFVPEKKTWENQFVVSDFDGKYGNTTIVFK